MPASYEALRAQVEAQGLYQRRYGFYGIYALLVFAGVAASAYLIVLNPSPYLQIPNAFFLGFLLVQAGMLGHDLSHQQVFSSVRTNRYASALVWGLFGGLSEGGWYKKHNAHHKYVNQIGHDPDVDMPFIFSRKQVPYMPALARSYWRNQHRIFFAVLPLVYFSMLRWSWAHLLAERSWRTALGMCLIVLHMGLRIGLPLLFLPLPLALLFIAIVAGTNGLYMSLAFAPNHKAEAIIGADESPTWLTQITSTRNLRPSWAYFFIFGGLNYQIEHHLFTSMARINYRRAHPIVLAFCEENGIPYHETSWAGSMQEIYQALKREAVAHRATQALSTAPVL